MVSISFGICKGCLTTQYTNRTKTIVVEASGVARILLQGARVPKFVVTKLVIKFFATACHSNSNQCFNMRDRPISTNKKRLQNFACIKLQGARAPVLSAQSYTT